MKFGVCLPIRRDTSLDFNIELAVRAEELGFDSVWASDHVAVPLSQSGRFTKYFYDPFVLLSAIAAKTSEISIGTSLLILPYRNPVVVANMVSCLDIMSKGRVVFGVATGWLKDEFDILGVPFEKRGKRTNEYIEIMKELWVSEQPEYSGSYFRFSDLEFYPKPFQKPHPELWVGGNSSFAMERALKYGTGWQPTWVTPAELKSVIADMNSRMSAEKADNFVYSVRNRTVITPEKDKNLPECYFSGTVSDIANSIRDYQESGVGHILFDPETGNDEDTFQLLETISKEIIPGFNS